MNNPDTPKPVVTAERAREVLEHLREQERVGMFAKSGHIVSFGEAADTIESLLALAEEARITADYEQLAAKNDVLCAALNKVFEFLGGRDDASEIRGIILEALMSPEPK